MVSSIRRELIRASRRLTESDCRQAILSALEDQIYCEPIEDKVRKGLPDVYIDGGLWIECKAKVLTARGSGYNILNEYTTSQKRRLLRSGKDTNLTALLFISPAGETAFVICRFGALYSTPGQLEKRCYWTFKRARAWGVPLDQAGEYIRAVVLDPWQGVRKHLDLHPEWPATMVVKYAFDKPRQCRPVE